MGTRHLICVQKDGEYKVAQYGQWDGYPSGQGLRCLSFLREDMVRPVFDEKVSACFWLDEEALKRQWVECGAEPDAEWVGIDVGDLHAERFPENSRDTGARILWVVQDSEKPLGLTDNLSFAGDGLFCEYAYVIDLDQDTFEVYKGFSEEKPDGTGRFDDLEPYKAHGDTLYYPVTLLAGFDLDDLPTDEEFLDICTKQGEE